ncbi:MAG: PaaI family thioesterase [Syntrophomonadaceae bacterium]|jgi:uncharacterized protein (TIGR00369 family)|nr:PaaI family thioesterase [Syntrophomonadaceae bacterium]
MKTLNPEHLKAVMDLINQGPFFKLLSMKVSEMGLGYARVELDLQEKHLNPFGGVHGGVYSSLIDTVTYWAVYCDMDEDSGLISLDVTVDNLAPVKNGHLVVEGKRIKAGRTVCLAEATVFDGKGKSLAFGISKQMVTPGLQTISQAVAAMGYKTLPAKYIT